MEKIRRMVREKCKNVGKDVARKRERTTSSKW